MTRTLTVSLITLGDPGRLTGGYLYHRRMAEAAPAHDARVHFIAVPERPFPLAAADAPAVLRRARALRARALVLDSIAAAYLGPWLAVRPLDLPLLGSLHQPPGGIDHGPLRTRVQGVLDRLAYRRASRLLVASASLAEELAAQGFPPERLTVVPPGRDVESGAARSGGPGKAELRAGRRAAFLCVGNWVERKGILDLLEAYARLPAGAGTLHLAGDVAAEPSYAARVRARLRRPDLSDRVVVHGPLSREDVGALYRSADALVLPSYREPYGTVYGEAMAAGLPVVGWRAGNLPYLADHAREGLLLEPGDLEGLAAALLRLAEDEAFRSGLGDAAARRASTRPTWDDSAALFFAAIWDAVGGLAR